MSLSMRHAIEEVGFADVKRNFILLDGEGYKAYPQSRYGGNKEYVIWKEGAERYGLTQR